MLRSNPSALADVRAWAAALLSLLILALHARTGKAINLLEPYNLHSPITEIPWLPFGKISGVEGCFVARFRWAPGDDHRLHAVTPPASGESIRSG
jgi:hypothetical protein